MYDILYTLKVSIPFSQNLWLFDIMNPFKNIQCQMKVLSLYLKVL